MSYDDEEIVVGFGDDSDVTDDDHEPAVLVTEVADATATAAAGAEQEAAATKIQAQFKGQHKQIIKYNSGKFAFEICFARSTLVPGSQPIHFSNPDSVI